MLPVNCVTGLPCSCKYEFHCSVVGTSDYETFLPLNVELKGGIEMNGDRESTAWDKDYTPPAKALGKNLAHSFIISNDESRRWGRESESFSPGGNAKD